MSTTDQEAERERIDADELARENAERECLAVTSQQRKAKRLEAIKPDAEKLKTLGNTLWLIEYPEMVTAEGEARLWDVKQRVTTAAIYCRDCWDE